MYNYSYIGNGRVFVYFFLFKKYWNVWCIKKIDKKNIGWCS